MDKPDQEELDTCREVLEYLAAETRANEPYATNTIADLEAVLGAMPYTEDEIGDMPDG